jgi:NAD(P)-dependent dehydrogenase (short-subunit alcohol dehydrogenase family)
MVWKIAPAIDLSGFGMSECRMDICMTDCFNPTVRKSLIPSFAEGARVLIVGAQGGIGAALIERLLRDPLVIELNAWSRRPINNGDSAIKHASVDITVEASLAAAASALGSIDLVIVATGLLHGTNGTKPEKSWKDFGADQFTENFLINTIGPALVAKHVLSFLPRRGRAVFAALSARVGSIEDNRLGGWYSYRASKAALNQVIKSLSIELARGRPDAVCVGLHPGTVDTNLSRPFQGNVAPGKLLTSDMAAIHLLGVIDGLEASDTGGVFAWDGARIPY